MNSQASRKVKASAARTTRFIAARNAGKNGSTRCGGLVPAIAERVERGARRAEIDDGEEEGGQRIDAEMRAEPGQAERQHDVGGRRRAEKVDRTRRRSRRRRPQGRRRR